MESTDAHTAHLQETFCDRRLEPLDDRIPPQMLEKLDFSNVHAGTAEEQWKMLYQVLFPGDGEVPSPYDQHAFTPRPKDGTSLNFSGSTPSSFITQLTPTVYSDAGISRDDRGSVISAATISEVELKSSSHGWPKARIRREWKEDEY
ncbi:hypothetical protein CC80DRAFT_544797 [Byssothecium circinans]|uniref:Uncharacterized protein n=1 Tax=Byssothecium circinans TaxID=147558 RepID=A0A6A5U5B0_9PLEO|nr:hypothetical protein CC80DRAFT_544797 [Byssothecium circinans]